MPPSVITKTRCAFVDMILAFYFVRLLKPVISRLLSLNNLFVYYCSSVSFWHSKQISQERVKVNIKPVKFIYTQNKDSHTHIYCIYVYIYRVGNREPSVFEKIPEPCEIPKFRFRKRFWCAVWAKCWELIL